MPSVAGLVPMLRFVLLSHTISSMLVIVTDFGLHLSSTYVVSVFTMYAHNFIIFLGKLFSSQQVLGVPIHLSPHPHEWESCLADSEYHGYGYTR